MQYVRLLGNNMCGIVGILTFKEPFETNLIFRSNDTLSPRGPDGEGYFFSDLMQNQIYLEKPRDISFGPMLSLAHRRLAIIDPEGGKQPMCNEDGTVWITFNGEIYNFPEIRKILIKSGHLFKTDHSDTEVIIHAYEEWGINSFNKFNGIFAFAIADLKKELLLLARDHFGVKPLYYYFDGDKLLFSSEAKAILTDDSIQRRLDVSGLGQFLTFRYTPSPNTLIQNLKKVPSGCFLKCGLKTGENITLQRYYNSHPKINYKYKFKDFIAEYQYHLEEAVKRQLISDVEVGALLSGGIDSSVVCAIAKKHLSHKLKTYTVGFKGGGEVNEITEAREFANYLGTEHKEVIIDNEDFINMLNDAVYILDEPIATSSSIALYYLTKEIKKDVKVVLTGQGADEPLAGYPRYYGERLYNMGFKYLGSFSSIIEMVPRNERIKRAFRSFSEKDAYQRFINVYSLFNNYQKNNLLRISIAEDIPIHKELFDCLDIKDNLAKMLFIDTRTWLSDDLLIYGDKMCMANSIEARVPILDVELVEFIETIPSKYKLSITMKGKWIHKIAAQKWLPDYVIKRKKKGFLTPIDKWFQNELFGYVKDTILNGITAKALFNKSYLEYVLTAHYQKKENFQRHILALLMLELWAKRFKILI